MNKENQKKDLRKPRNNLRKPENFKRNEKLIEYVRYVRNLLREKPYIPTKTRKRPESDSGILRK